MTHLPCIDGFDLIAAPRARRLARARRRHLTGWLGVAVCSGALMFVLDGLGAWRERAGAEDQGRYRAQLVARVRALAPVWQDARRLTGLMDQAAAGKKALAGFGDRRWALHALLDALARAATPGLALQRLHYHAAGQPRWPASPWPSVADAARRSRYLTLAAPRVGLNAEASPETDAGGIDAASVPPERRDAAAAFALASTSGAEGVADTFSEAAPLHVIPRTASLALTVQGIADADDAMQEWIVRLQRDPRVSAVTVDAFVHESERPTPQVWGSRSPARAVKPMRSGLTRFRVSVFGRSSTDSSTGVAR